MDQKALLQQLSELHLEEGYRLLEFHAPLLKDYDKFCNLLTDEALRQMYQPFLSLKLAEYLLFFGQLTGHKLSQIAGLKSKGNVLRYTGQHREAMDYLDQAGKEYLALDQEVQWARTRVSWILAAASLGNIEAAFQQAAEARAIFERHQEYYWSCIIDHNTAVIYADLGRYRDAINLYERMLKVYPLLSGPDETSVKRATAMAQVNRGVHFIWLGEFEQAYQLLQEALESFTALREFSQIINTELHLADIEYAHGYYGSALRRYYQAQDTLLLHHVDNPRLLAELQLQMAKALVKLNRVQEACQLAQKAVTQYQQLNSPLQTSNALREYAACLVVAKLWQEAYSILKEAWKLFDKGGFHYHAAFTQLHQAEVLLHMGQIAEAYQEAEISSQHFADHGLVIQSTRAQLIMIKALIALMENGSQPPSETIELQQAMRLCNQVIKQGKQHQLSEAVYQGHYLLGRLFLLCANRDQAIDHYCIAIEQIESILDDLVYDLSPSFLHSTWIVYEEMISCCLERGEREKAFCYLEQARSMALRQYLHTSLVDLQHNTSQNDMSYLVPQQNRTAAILRTRHELQTWQENYRHYSSILARMDDDVLSTAVNRQLIEEEVERCEARVGELFERLLLHQSTPPATQVGTPGEKRVHRQLESRQIREHLGEQQLLLTYFIHHDDLIIFALSSQETYTSRIPEGAKQLHYLLPLLHAHLHPQSWHDPQRPQQKALRRMLQKLYGLLIHPVASLLPSEKGTLTIVPYGPLHQLPFHALFDGESFLIEKYQINYLPASTILTQTRRIEPKTTAEPRRPLIFGYSGHKPIHRALSEAQTLAELLGGDCYLEDEATIAHLLQKASGSPLIHLATHGQSRLDAPNFSSILLADGRFNAIDTFSLDLTGCELVTLSGCETGLALSGGGDEQLGLGRAFLAAGASSLVMSLWPVEDNATSELMTLFYRQLLQGASKIEALRTAQCTLLQQRDTLYTHPYFWAAFRLVGEIGPLTCQSSTNLKRKDIPFPNHLHSVSTSAVVFVAIAIEQIRTTINQEGKRGPTSS